MNTKTVKMYASADILIPALVENTDAAALHDVSSNASVYMENL